EDGIRDFHVTGVQTCALPILFVVFPVSCLTQVFPPRCEPRVGATLMPPAVSLKPRRKRKAAPSATGKRPPWPTLRPLICRKPLRSEERRVGKEQETTG